MHSHLSPHPHTYTPMCVCTVAQAKMQGWNDSVSLLTGCMPGTMALPVLSLVTCVGTLAHAAGPWLCPPPTPTQHPCASGLLPSNQHRVCLSQSRSTGQQHNPEWVSQLASQLLFLHLLVPQAQAMPPSSLPSTSFRRTPVMLGLLSLAQNSLKLHSLIFILFSF